MKPTEDREMRHLLIIIVMLAAALPAFAAAGFTFEPIHQVGTAGQFELVSLHCWLTNTGDDLDTFTLHKDEFLPADWQSSFCEGEICYPPFLHDVEVVLGPGGSAEILVDIQVNTIVGSGYDHVTITSGNDPGVTGDWVFAAIHNDCDVLVIEDTYDGTALRTLLETHMAPTIPGIWPRAAEAPTLADLQAFPKTFWFTGTHGPSFDAGDQAVIGDFLSAGGKLLISGQNAASDLCDPGSAWYSVDSCNWYEATTGCEWTADHGPSGPLLSGEPGSYLGDNLDLQLDLTQVECDELALGTGVGSVAFRYPNGNPAGLIRTDNGRLVNLGFDIEGVEDDRGSLATLLERICTVLDDPTGVDHPAAFALRVEGNYPNPFNPKTNIRFTAGQSGTGELSVLDVRGRLLHRETLLISEGVNQVAFGGEELSSGVYLYKVQMNGETAAGRMVLAK